jgi:hypothetical protein
MGWCGGDCGMRSARRLLGTSARVDACCVRREGG